MNLRMLSALGAAFFIATLCAPAQDKKLACGDSQNGKRSHVCEMRETSLAYTGKLDIDATPNGGISVIGWDRNEVLVRARVDAWGDTDSEAKNNLSQVQIQTAGSTVKADGPRSGMLGKWGGQQNWSVSYEVFSPRKMDLKMTSVNGGIKVNSVKGNIRFETVNGGITLSAVNGTVKGETVNGGVNVDIAGNRWEGEGLQVETVNGGVTLSLPTNFAADIQARTTNGGMHSEFEGAVTQGKWGPKRMELKLGGGGPLVKLETVNGGVNVRKKS